MRQFQTLRKVSFFHFCFASGSTAFSPLIPWHSPAVMVLVETMIEFRRFDLCLTFHKKVWVIHGFNRRLRNHVSMECFVYIPHLCVGEASRTNALRSARLTIDVGKVSASANLSPVAISVMLFWRSKLNDLTIGRLRLLLVAEMLNSLRTFVPQDTLFRNAPLVAALLTTRLGKIHHWGSQAGLHRSSILGSNSGECGRRSPALQVQSAHMP